MQSLEESLGYWAVRVDLECFLSLRFILEEVVGGAQVSVINLPKTPKAIRYQICHVTGAPVSPHKKSQES